MRWQTYYFIPYICSMKPIKIPNIERDERIGSVFNWLFRVMSQTENAPENGVQWDLSEVSFLHPFFLAPLVIYKESCGRSIECIGIPDRISKYFDLIHFDKPLYIEEEIGLENTLNEYISKSYIPVCQFELCKGNIDEIQSILQKVIRTQSHADNRIVTPLSYMLGELIDNMGEHSNGRYGYIFSQYLKKEECIDLVIADDGITIYGNYAKFGLYQNEIDGDESIALKLANEGKSTKNLPNAENRGYGISSSKKMLADGLKGAFFMLSGGAFHRHDINTSVYVALPSSIYWEGTIILMRIPIKVPLEFEYNKYI